MILANPAVIFEVCFCMTTFEEWFVTTFEVWFVTTFEVWFVTTFEV